MAWPVRQRDRGALVATVDFRSLDAKVERVHHRLYPTRDVAGRDLFGYIEGFYNSRRLHSEPGYRSPANMERLAA